jgi:hypothetical protein
MQGKRRRSGQVKIANSHVSSSDSPVHELGMIFFTKR